MAQRDQFIRDLYAILFSFIVETANHKICSATAQDAVPAIEIIVFDQPGFQFRGPITTGSKMLMGLPLSFLHMDKARLTNFVSTLWTNLCSPTHYDAVGYNGHITGDGIFLLPIPTMDNMPCVELFRGASLSERAFRKPAGLLGVMAKACSSYKSDKAGDKRAEDMLQDFISKLKAYPSFVASPSQVNLFAINPGNSRTM